MAIKAIEVLFDVRIGMFLCTVRQKGKKAPMGDAFAKTKEEAQSRALNIAGVSNYFDGTGMVRVPGKGLSESELVNLSGTI